MRTVDAIIREVVEKYAVVYLDDNGHIITYDTVEEKEVYDVELVEILGDVEEDEPLDDPRETE